MSKEEKNLIKFYQRCEKMCNKMVYLAKKEKALNGRQKGATLSFFTKAQYHCKGMQNSLKNIDYPNDVTKL